ncbi:MAG: hypothetical protein WED34_18960, partial [Planctomycetales bacterium]
DHQMLGDTARLQQASRRATFRYQQNLSGLQIALIVLTPCTNRLVDILPLMPKVHEVLETVRPGDVVEVGWLAR